LKAEQEEYNLEGIKKTNISFVNKKICDLIESSILFLFGCLFGPFIKWKINILE